MQRGVTIAERRECNPQGLVAWGGGEGSFFCGLVLAQQQCPGQVVLCYYGWRIDLGISRSVFPGQGLWGRHRSGLQLRNFPI